jgi:hypothetical protein
MYVKVSRPIVNPSRKCALAFKCRVLHGPIQIYIYIYIYIYICIDLLGHFDVHAACTNLPDSYFVSLTYPTLARVSASNVSALSTDEAPVQALELRVDLLKATDEVTIATEVARLRKLSSLPIIYTVFFHKIRY